MVDGRLEVDEWLVDGVGHGIELRFGQIKGHICAFGKRADAEHIAVRGQHRYAFTHVFAISNTVMDKINSLMGSQDVEGARRRR